MSRPPLKPSEAIKSLFAVLSVPGIVVVPAYVAQDLANVRRACPADDDFAAAVLAIAKEIRLAHASPERHGIPVEHALNGWRRSKFAAKPGKALLRLVFRPADSAGVQILAFGDRDFPASVYHTAKSRAEPR